MKIEGANELIKGEGRQQFSKQRESNLELFRIITMLFIIAHHYVVNSGLTQADGPITAAPTSASSIFLLLFGAWGKTGINCFVMITGYFMCKSQITAKKFAKLLCEVMFYRLIIYFVFIMIGYRKFSVTALLTTLIPIKAIEVNFTDCFMTFFLFIPFLNILVHNINERQHVKLLLLVSFTYILFGTIHGGSFGVKMNYVSWFMVLYLIASYFRLYPKKWHSNNKVCGAALLIAFCLSISSVIGCTWIGAKLNKFIPYYFVTDSNTILAVLVAIFSFLFFKNLHIPYNKVINTIAASTFGVFLIHTRGDIMRKWLWKDTIDCVGHYDDKYLPLYAIGCVLSVFIVCTVIDIVRINLFEKPFFNWWDKHWESFCKAYKLKEDKLFQKFNINGSFIKND